MAEFWEVLDEERHWVSSLDLLLLFCYILGLYLGPLRRKRGKAGV